MNWRSLPLLVTAAIALTSAVTAADQKILTTEPQDSLNEVFLPQKTQIDSKAPETQNIIQSTSSEKLQTISEESNISSSPSVPSEESNITQKIKSTIVSLEENTTQDTSEDIQTEVPSEEKEEKPISSSTSPQQVISISVTSSVSPISSTSSASSQSVVSDATSGSEIDNQVTSANTVVSNVGVSQQTILSKYIEFICINFKQ